MLLSNHQLIFPIMLIALFQALLIFPMRFEKKKDQKKRYKEIEAYFHKIYRDAPKLLKEDECQIYADDGAKNLATIIRKLLNLIKSHPLKDSVAGKR